MEDYPVTVFLSREGYFKKITPQSLRMSGEQKYKEGDGPGQQAEATNAAEVMFFTDRCQVYKTRLSEFGDSKASVLGDYLPAKLGMDEGESVVYMVLPGDYSGHLLFFFENGKIARVEMKAYATVSNRRKLTGAYSDKSRLVAILPLAEDRELALLSTEPRALIFHTSLLLPKATRSTQGVAVMTLKPKYQLQRVCTPEESGIVNLPPLSGPQHPRYRRSPAVGGPGRGAADPAVRKKEEPMKRNVLTQYLIITASCALYAVGFNWMFDPNHISVGGFTGLGQIINYLLPGLPIGTIVIILNVPLFVLGWRFIGKDFLFSSVYATVVSSLMIDGLAAVHTFKPMEPILACLYGGVIIGVSCGIMLREGPPPAARSWRPGC